MTLFDIILIIITLYFNKGRRFDDTLLADLMCTS